MATVQAMRSVSRAQILDWVAEMRDLQIDRSILESNLGYGIVSDAIVRLQVSSISRRLWALDESIIAFS